MAYDKYKSAAAITTGAITTDHDGLWIGSNSSGTGGTNGDLVCTFAKDTVAVTLKGVSSGTLLPFEVNNITDATTKCGNIVAVESGERWST